jgi:hypothetical protein
LYVKEYKLEYSCVQISITEYIVNTQEAKYVECGSNITFVLTGWSRFKISVNRYGGLHFQLISTSITMVLLLATRLANRKILIEHNIIKRTGSAL